MHRLRQFTPASVAFVNVVAVSTVGFTRAAGLSVTATRRLVESTER